MSVKIVNKNGKLVIEPLPPSENIRDGGKVAVYFSDVPVQPKKEVILRDIEKQCVDNVYRILQDGGIDTSNILIFRQESYLRLQAHKADFLRIKLFGKKQYFSVCLSSDLIRSLSLDARFSNVKFTYKRFNEIPIVAADDVNTFADVILFSYERATTPYIKSGF